MFTNAVAELLDDGLERVESELKAQVGKATEKLRRARGVAQKHRRRKSF